MYIICTMTVISIFKRWLNVIYPKCIFIATFMYWCRFILYGHKPFDLHLGTFWTWTICLHFVDSPLNLSIYTWSNMSFKRGNYIHFYSFHSSVPLFNPFPIKYFFENVCTKKVMFFILVWVLYHYFNLTVITELAV